MRENLAHPFHHKVLRLSANKPGDLFASRQPDPVLQQVEQYHDASISTNDCFRPVSRYWDRISRPEQLMSALINAMRVLTDPADTGAVTLLFASGCKARPMITPAFLPGEYTDRTPPPPVRP